MITVPIVFGYPIYVWGGILLVILLIFQMLTGMNILKVSVRYHRINGYLIAIMGILHAVAALGIWFFGFMLG